MQFRLLATLALLFLPLGCSQESADKPQNIILVIADGTGPATYTLGREYRTIRDERPLVFDEILTGAVRTSAADSRVTDSASSATAMASGIKTNNGMIGMDPLQESHITALEVAMGQGMATGLISTARITHATAASFGAHVIHRSQEEDIAEQLLSTRPDLMLGGGLALFLPETADGVRQDGQDLVAQAEASGYQVVLDEQSFLGGKLPLLGLFSDSHMAYEIDRDETSEPSLATMTEQALKLLSGPPNGFFLMVEAGRIDHAAHGNDVAAHLHDFLAYDDAVRVVMEFARREGNTLVVVTSDHETGGLSLARDGVYEWYPEAIGKITASIGRLVERAHAVVQSDSGDSESVLANMLASSGVGIGEGDSRELGLMLDGDTFPADLKPWLENLTAKQGGIAWTTHGHTGVDVPLHAFGPGSGPFSRVIQNDELGRRLLEALRLP